MVLLEPVSHDGAISAIRYLPYRSNSNRKRKPLNATTMRNSIITLTILATIGILGFASSASANVANQADPKIRIGSANIHIVFHNGYRYERFHYYPRYDVYFSYHSNKYYWYDRGRWHNARRLPKHMRYLERERYVVISARHDRPWTYHENRWRYDSRNDRWDRRQDGR